MALELSIPPCASTPPNSLHHPPLEKPLRIQIEGEIESFKKVLPDAPWPTAGELSAFPQPVAQELARIAFQTIYGREARPEVVGDLIVRDEHLGWIPDGTTSKKLVEYGVTFDHLVPPGDHSPEVLQIMVVEVKNKNVAHLERFLLCEIDPDDIVGKKLLAVPRCCRKMPGIDCEYVNRAVDERDRGAQKREEILSAALNGLTFPAQAVSPSAEELSLERLSMNEVSDYLARRSQRLNDASKEKFDYGERLQKGHIRVLQVQPGSGEDPIVCSLLLGSLDTVPFEAVSYAWGSEDNPHSITCNWATPSIDEEGFRIIAPTEVTNNMKITKNLYDLLLRIREPTKMRTLWIDQICIDQDKNPAKLEEKMDQVRNMAEVYSAAVNVLIWLGEEDEETAAAFGMMKWLAVTTGFTEKQLVPLIYYLLSTEDFSDNEAEDPVQHEQYMEYLKSLLVYVQPREIRGAVNPAFPNQGYITLLGSRAFADLLNKPWFSRSWTFQETISARSATVMCGSHAVPWDTLYQACKSMQNRRIKVDESDQRSNLALIIESIIKKGDLQRDWARMKRRDAQDHGWLTSGAFLDQRRIKRLLPILRQTACKDPRDKVLALLGISHDDNRWIEFPNYKWPVVNLYTSIVSYWVWGVDKMDISFLNHVQDSNPEHGLPSWTPDWSTPPVATPLIDVANFSASGDTVPNVFMDRIDYLGDLKPFPYFPPLAIEGYFILKVQDVEVDLRNYERHAQMINQFEHPYPISKLSYPEAYQKTICPKIPDDFKPIVAGDGLPSFWEYNDNYEASKPSSEEVGSGEATQSFTERYTAQDLQTSLLLPDDANSQVQHHTRAIAPGRAFFVTTTGFIGLCPRGTVPGDDIYVLLGGAIPFVITGTNSKSGIVRLVGECFVLGVMHGETLEGRPSQKTLVILR